MILHVRLILCWQEISAGMKLRPLGSWKMYSSALYFGHPPVTWQLRADANVEDLLGRNCPKKGDITWQSWCSILYPCVLTQALLLKHTGIHPESFLVSVDSLFPPFLPLL